MKKTLLTAIAVAATMSMSAAVPTFTYTSPGVNTPVTQTALSYSNPCAYDDNNNAFIAGRFKGEFTFGSSTVKSDDEGAYLVKFDMNLQPVWAVAVSGVAKITATTTDSQGNVYIAGQYRDDVVFGSTDNKTVTKPGVEIKDAPQSVTLGAAFIAKYTSAGVLSTVETFVPDDFDPTEVVQEMNGFDKLADIESLHFNITKIKAYGDRVYASAIYTGATVCQNYTFSGGVVQYDDFWMWEYCDWASVFSFDTTLSDLQIEQSYKQIFLNSYEPYESIFSVDFDVNDKGVYGVFSASGDLDIRGKGGISTGVDLTYYNNGEFEVGYVFVSPVKEEKPIVLRTTTTTMKFPFLAVNAACINGSSLTAVGDYTGMSGHMSYLPATVRPTADTGVDGTEKTRMFAASVNLADFSFVKAVADAEDAEGNCPLATSAAMINSAMFINTVVSTYKSNGTEIVSAQSKWFDGEAFSAAPINAYGIAVSSGASGMVLLPSSTLTDMTYKFAMYTKEQSGLQNIAAEDADAPVEYFNLQGIRVENPANGLYIRRQGSKVEKVIL